MHGLHTHTLTLLTLCALLGGALVACDDASYRDTAPEDTASGDTTTPANAQPADDDPADTPTTTTPQPLTEWCRPQPIAYDTAAIPALAKEVHPDNACDASAPEPPFEPTNSKRFTIDAAGREVAVEDFSVLSYASYSFDADGRVRAVFTDGGGGFYGAGMGRSWYDLNEAGEMVHKVAAQLPWQDAPEEEWTVLVKEQTWDGDRLLSRTERLGEDGPILRRWTWTWDGDALVHVELLETDDPAPTRRVEARWTYHPTGQPASVERLIDGVLVEREAWTFRDNGALRTRTYWAEPTDMLAQEHGGDPYQWLLPQGLDDHQNTNPNDYNSDPWPHALPVQREGCAELPRGAGHGYPDAEAHYQLGVSRTERASNTGFAYGNNGYGWYYSERAWYGHLGLASGELLDVFYRRAALDVRLAYDAQGRMIQSDADVRYGDTTLDVARTRVFDGDLLTSDTLRAAADDASAEYTLSFGYDDRGHLSSRTLSSSEGVAQRQTWTRDARGRVTTHTVSPDQAPLAAVPAPITTVAFSQAGSIEQTTSWFWRYDGDHLVERGQNGNPEIHQTLAYDAQGHLIATEGVFSSDAYYPEQRWAYDAEGRLIEECNRFDTTTHCTETAWDSEGRVAWRAWRENDGPAQPMEHFTYVCR